MGDPARTRDRRDYVLDPMGRTLLAEELGRYDALNHYLRLDGAEDLYFLRGTPQTSHEAKVLCRIDSSGALRECFRWDTEPQHLTGSTASLLLEGALARAYRIFGPDPYELVGYIEALDLATGRSLWRRPVPALATCLAPVAGRPWLLYGLTDGRLGILDSRTGELLHEEALRIDGVSTMAMSLSGRGDRFVCGTLDGRLLVLRVEARPTGGALALRSFASSRPAKQDTRPGRLAAAIPALATPRPPPSRCRRARRWRRREASATSWHLRIHVAGHERFD